MKIRKELWFGFALMAIILARSDLHAVVLLCRRPPEPRRPRRTSGC